MADINEKITYFEDLFCGSQLSSMQASDLLLTARKFFKIEEKYKEKNSQKLINKKIAVLASYTTHHLIAVMKLFLYREGILLFFMKVNMMELLWDYWIPIQKYLHLNRKFCFS